MSAAAKSVYLFGLWAIVAGWGLLLAPVQILGIVQLTVAEPVYIRIIGFILVEIGILYLWVARLKVEAIFPLTIKIRMIPVVALTVFFVLKWAPWQVLLFAVVDALSALHTWFALKKNPGKK